MAEYHQKKRRRDDDIKTRKNITLNADVVEKIQRFADDNEVSFSAAIESLSLVGLGDETFLAIIPIVTSRMYRDISNSFNRIAKLAAFAAIEAGQAKEIMKMTLLQDIRQKWNDYGDDYEDAMFVEKNHVTRQTHSKFVNRARVVTLTKLREPIKELEDILMAQEVQDGE